MFIKSKKEGDKNNGNGQRKESKEEELYNKKE